MPISASRIPGRLSRACALSTLLLVSACSVQPEPLSAGDVARRAEADAGRLFAVQEPIAAPIGLAEAVARAIRYNLDNRVRMMETAVAQGIAEAGSYDMLPKLAASAGYLWRSNENATVSRSLTSGATSRDYSTSLDRERGVGALSTTWNVLDFGISYIRARQNADRILIAEERRRRALQTIIRDARSAYWRAVAAERLEADVGPLMSRLQRALDSARKVGEQRLQQPAQALEYQRALLDILYQMQSLRRDLSSAKVDLAVLMNLDPGQSFTLVHPAEGRLPKPKVPNDLDALERTALVNRPELREEDYQERIGADEVRKAMLRMIPGVEVLGSVNSDSNSYLRDASWAEAGLKLAWNLTNLVSGPSNIRLAETQAELTRLRRLALSVAIVGQVHVSRRRLELALADLEVLDDIYRVDRELHRHAEAAEAAATHNELDLIRREANMVLSRLRRDLALAEMQNAAGTLYDSLGVDPFGGAEVGSDLPSLTAAVAKALARWESAELVEAAGEATGAPPPAAVDALPVAAPDWTTVVGGAAVADPVWTFDRGNRR